MDLGDLIEMIKPILFGLTPTILLFFIIMFSLNADSYAVDVEYLNGMITILGILVAFWIFLLERSPRAREIIKEWQQKHIIVKYFLYIPIPSLFLSIFSFYYSSLHTNFYFFSIYTKSSFITLMILTLSSLYNLFLLTSILYYVYYLGIED